MRIAFGLLLSVCLAANVFLLIDRLSWAPCQTGQITYQEHDPEYWPPIYGYKLKVTDTLGALAGLAAGILGPLGAAFAVYLTLRGQRKDETEKISTAIIGEIAQLAKFPLEQFEMIQRIYQKRLVGIPRSGLPAFMQTPPPTLYLAAAERISRVHRPILVIAFYMGLAETERVVNVVAKFPSPNVYLTPTDVEGLGVMLREQCFLARQILSNAPTPGGKEQALVAQTYTVMVGRLDELLAKAKDVFPTAEQYEMKTVI